MPEEIAKGLPASAPWAAGFAAGIVFNRLRFHSQQALFFFQDHVHRKPLELMANYLSLVVRNFVLPESRDCLQETIARWIKKELEGVGSEGYAERIGELIPDEVRETYARTGEVDWRPLQRIVNDQLADLENLQERIISHIQDHQTRVAFRLGERLDQVLCPVKVWVHCYNEEPSEQIVCEPGQRLGLGALSERASRTSFDPVAGYLPNVYRWPGEIEPENNWFFEIRQLCAELQISSEVLAPFADLVLPEEPEQRAQARREMVCRIAESVFQRLSRAETEPSSPRIPPSNQTQGDVNDARDRWIYEQCCDGTPYDDIISQLRRNHEGWRYIKSATGIRNAAQQYAKRHKVSPPPRRRRTNA
jgi:hypothetical protein